MSVPCVNFKSTFVDLMMAKCKSVLRRCPVLAERVKRGGFATMGSESLRGKIRTGFEDTVYPFANLA